MTRLLTEQVYTQAMNEIVEPYLNAHGASFFLCREADRAIHVLLYRTKKPPRGTILVSHGFTENMKNIRNLFITCCKAVITSAFRSTAVTDTAIA